MTYVERFLLGGVEVTMDATSANVTYPLPSNFASTRRFVFRRLDSSTHTATVTVATGGYIDDVLNATKSIPAESEITFEAGDNNTWQTYGGGGGSTDNPGADAWLKLHAGGNLDALLVGTITRDANGVATGGGVVWPDGITGTYTATVLDATTGGVNAYTITYAGSTTKTVTQPTMTRDASGGVTTRPAMVVS